MATTKPGVGRFFTIKQVAETLGVSEKTVVRYIGGGWLRSHEFGRCVRISEHDLMSFVAARRR